MVQQRQVQQFAGIFQPFGQLPVRFARMGTAAGMIVAE